MPIYPSPFDIWQVWVDMAGEGSYVMHCGTQRHAIDRQQFWEYKRGIPARVVHKGK
jgi:hypothetical protein